MKIPKHILEYSRMIKASKLDTRLYLNHFYLHGKIEATVNSMIREELSGNNKAIPRYVHQFEVKYLKLDRVPNKATIITRVYQYYDESDGYWKKKVLCDLPLMVKENYFQYKFNKRYSEYSYNTENTDVLHVKYNMGTKKYQIYEKKLIDKIPALISDYYTIYTKSTSLNLLYNGPRINDVTIYNPRVHRNSPFFEKLKAITFRCKNKTEIMGFTAIGGRIKRCLFGIIWSNKRLLAMTTDMVGTGVRTANETFLVSKNILKPSKDNKRTIFGDFVIESQSQTSNVYKAYINSFSDFKADGVNGKRKNVFTLAKLVSHYIDIDPGKHFTDTLQMPGFVFFESCIVSKMPQKNMHPIFGELQTFSAGKVEKYWDIETQASFIDYIDVSNYLGIGNGIKKGISTGEIIKPPVTKGRISDSLYLYCNEGETSLFTANNKYYTCIGSETFLRNKQLSPYIKNDYLEFTLKNNIRVSSLNFKLTTPTGKTLTQYSRGPTKPFRNLFFTIYLSNGMPNVRIAKEEQIVFLTQRQKTTSNNPFTVHIDETLILAKIKRHPNIRGNKVCGQLRQMIIPSKFTADVIKIDCDLKANTIINRDGQYANSLGYINLQRDDTYKAIKENDEQLTVVFDHETASGTSYKFDIKETSDIKTFTITLLNQDHNIIDFTNKILPVSAKLAIIFL